MKGFSLSRRNFLLGGGITALVAALDAFCIEPNWLRVTEHNLRIANLPKLMDGYRIAHVTDAHLRHIGAVEERIFREIEQRNVELVVLTGDIIDHSSQMNLLEDFCHHLQGKRRTALATLGNWEHWAGIQTEELRKTYRAHNIRLLVNESEWVNSALCVAATDDATGGHPLLDRTLDGCNKAAVRLFLTHSPKLLDSLPAPIGRFDLALAGHTHGGQCRIGSFSPVRPPGSGRFVSGWYSIPAGKAYVSCGTGTTMLPARFCCRPELPIFTLLQG
jgi:predicted MPP superfamily phosphohydrolase